MPNPEDGADTETKQEREISWIFDIVLGQFECPMSNIECPTNLTLS